MMKSGVLGTIQEAKRLTNEEKITASIEYIFFWKQGKKIQTKVGIFTFFTSCF